MSLFYLSKIVLLKHISYTNVQQKLWEVIKDKLGVVRIAKVKTPTTVLQRSIGKLCLVMETDMDNV